MEILNGSYSKLRCLIHESKEVIVRVPMPRITVPSSDLDSQMPLSWRS